MCPGHPVGDAVSLDVLVSWLSGRLFNSFIWDSTMFLFPSQTGPSPYINQVSIFSIFFPHSPNFDFFNP